MALQAADTVALSTLVESKRSPATSTNSAAVSLTRAPICLTASMRACCTSDRLCASLILAKGLPICQSAVWMNLMRLPPSLIAAR
jgi:hypothetical protein